MREILSGALGTFAFSVLMQVPRRLLFFTTFGGLLSGTVYRFAEENGMGAFGATLWGMLAVALYAELLARVLKTPSTVLLYPSTVPLLPGSAIYYAMQYLLWGQPDQAVAYASQTLRGAIQAIPKGQWESGAALGLSRPYTFIHLIMPQVWRHALPGLSNQWLVLLKDTALVSLIGVDDLMRQAGYINTNTHEPFTWYGIAALIYLVITLISQAGIRKLELRFTRFERGVE